MISLMNSMAYGIIISPGKASPSASATLVLPFPDAPYIRNDRFELNAWPIRSRVFSGRTRCDREASIRSRSKMIDCTDCFRTWAT